jgi:hypothetical protein
VGVVVLSEGYLKYGVISCGSDNQNAHRWSVKCTKVLATKA